MGDILSGINSGSYIDDEKVLSGKNKETISFYKKTLPKNVQESSEADQTAWKNDVKTLLNKILTLMRTNRDELNKRVSYLEESEAILKEEVDNFNEDDTIKSLQEKGINNGIMNIANVQFSDANSDMLEFKYRLGIISYKKLFFKAELRTIDLEIEQVQNYIDSLE